MERTLKYLKVAGRIALIVCAVVFVYAPASSAQTGSLGSLSGVGVSGITPTTTVTVTQPAPAPATITTTVTATAAPTTATVTTTTTTTAAPTQPIMKSMLDTGLALVTTRDSAGQLTLAVSDSLLPVGQRRPWTRATVEQQVGSQWRTILDMPLVHDTLSPPAGSTNVSLVDTPPTVTVRYTLTELVANPSAGNFFNSRTFAPISWQSASIPVV